MNVRERINSYKWLESFIVSLVSGGIYFLLGNPELLQIPSIPFSTFLRYSTATISLISGILALTAYLSNRSSISSNEDNDEHRSSTKKDDNNTDNSSPSKDGKNKGTGINEQQLSRYRGGEVAEIISELDGNNFRHCGLKYKIGTEAKIWGYPDHPKGYKDKEGNQWWMYVKCPRCGYNASVSNNLNAHMDESIYK